MKKIIILSFLLCSLLVSAKGFKINSKTEIKPYTIKIEKVETYDNKTIVSGKVKQQERYSYSISFEDCSIITDVFPKGVSGKLIEWNDDNKITNPVKPISDSHEEKFVLEFPQEVIPAAGYFSLKIGTTLNKNRTPLIIENLTIKKK